VDAAGSRARFVGRPRFWVLLLAGAYLALRLALVWRLPITYDEGQSAAEAQAAFEHPARQTLLLAVRERHGPLPSLFSLGPLALGVSALDSIRLLSVLAGAAGAAGAGLAARLLASPRAGLIAAALWIVLPFTLLYDSLGLGDGIAAAALAWALYLGLRLARAPSLRLGLVLGVVMALGVLGKQSALLGAVLLPLALFELDWRRDGLARRLLTFAAALAIVALFVAGALLVPQLAPRHLRIVGGLAAAQQTHSVDQAVTNYAVLARDNAPELNRAVVGYFGIPLLALTAFGVYRLLRRRRPAAAVAVAWLLVPAAALYALPVVPYPRYLSLIVPGLIVAAAAALRDLRAPLAAAAAVVALVAPVWLSVRTVVQPWRTDYPEADGRQFVSQWPAGTSWPAITQALMAQAPPRGADIAYDGVGFPPFGLAAQIGKPWFPVDKDGREPPGVVYATRGPSRFRLHHFTRGSKPSFVLEQGDAPGPTGSPGSGYTRVASYTRPLGGATVTLWRRDGGAAS
jgi:4-amino-4-deoxy-L-arabinose transferase-like glycosyltransferase